MAGLHKLSDIEARVLDRLAAYANRDGETKVSEATIATEVRRTERTVRRAIGKLRARGLVSIEQAGRQAAVRRLHDVVPRDQLSLDLTAENGACPPGQNVRPDSVRPDNSLDTSTGHPRVPRSSSGVINGGREDAHTRTGERALPVTLDEVCEIAIGAPEWGIVTTDAIATVLIAHPEATGHDHRLAALETLQQMQEAEGRGGKTTVVDFSYLLKRKLERQRRHPSAPVATSGGEHDKPAKPWAGALRRELEAAEQGGRS